MKNKTATLTNGSNNPPPKWKRWLRWSLRSQFIVIICVAVLLAAISNELSRLKREWMVEQPIIKKIEFQGGIAVSRPGENVSWLNRWPFRWFVHSKYLDRVLGVNLNYSTLTSKDLQDLHLEQLKWMGILHLYGCKNIDDEAAPTLLQFRELRDLTLSDTSITDVTLGYLKEHPHLVFLFISPTDNVTKQGIDALPDSISVFHEGNSFNPRGCRDPSSGLDKILGGN